MSDAAGNTYALLLRFTASDGTEMSIWTAQITRGAGTRPAITAKPTSQADVGVVALEYGGLSAATGSAVVDRLAQASGTTGASAASVSSGPTAPTTTPGLALGFYTDSGPRSTLTGGAGFTVRANLSGFTDMEALAEDRTVGVGAVPAASVGTSARTVWLMATVVLVPA